MLKLDHRKILKHLYHPSGRSPAIVDIPPMNFLLVKGHGKPDGKQFPQAAEVLFPLAYTIKWMIRLGMDVDFHVMPMEVRWQVDRVKKDFAWTMMLMQPEWVTTELVVEAKQKVMSKVKAGNMEAVLFERYEEGTCVQFLHAGPYETMDGSADRMAEYAQNQGYSIPIRNSHDIYLNDVRRTAPANLKAVIRFQVIRK